MFGKKKLALRQGYCRQGFDEGEKCKLLQTDLILLPFTSAMANTPNLQSKLRCLTLMSVNLRGHSSVLVANS